MAKEMKNRELYKRDAMEIFFKTNARRRTEFVNLCVLMEDQHKSILLNELLYGKFSSSR